MSPPKRPISIGSFETKLTWFMSPVGLLIDEIKLTGKNLVIDPDALADSTGEIEFVATVSSASIATFLDSIKPAGMQDFAVEIVPEGIVVNAVKKVIVPIPTRAVAEVVLIGDSELHLNLKEASALGAGLTTLVGNQIAEMNPLVRASMFPFPVRFVRVQHAPGAVLVFGLAAIQPLRAI